MGKDQEITSNISPPKSSLDVIKTYFSHCFSKNGDFNIEKFKQEFSESEVNFSNESYGLDWLGKSYAKALATQKVTTLIKEDRQFNQQKINESSKNLLIKGDSLEVLKHLSNTYSEKIKLIYIDPPYNTGGDGFLYQDDRKFSIDEFCLLTGLNKKRAEEVLSFVDNKSNSHSAWLTFIYPRLYLARQLLREDGAIFVSIDENEVAQLRLIMDELFGEENFISHLIWINNKRGRSIDKFIANTNESILMFAKNRAALSVNQLIERGDDILKKYPLEDEISRYKKGDPLYNNNTKFNIDTRPNLVYSIYINKETKEYRCIDEKIKENNHFILPTENMLGDEWIKVIPPFRKNIKKLGCWRWSVSKFNLEAKSELILVKNKRTDKYMFYSKNRLNKSGEKFSTYKNIIQGIHGGGGTIEISKILGGKYFDHPKPLKLIRHLLKIATSSSDIILDFFAGSGSTADAVMRLNAEDGGNRRYILVQIPESIDEKKNRDAYNFVKNKLKIDCPTIFEITKERVIRVANKIKEDSMIKQDLGFKIFETIPVSKESNVKDEPHNALK